ncbi:hypothetical protein EG329_001123 [Mollisiaceae sp. DMI_Dod_QoI]|nr:hypothetical protein EG329_001123 [Helotiales sp. DMI_Dod_QoI]
MNHSKIQSPPGTEHPSTIKFLAYLTASYIMGSRFSRTEEEKEQSRIERYAGQGFVVNMLSSNQKSASHRHKPPSSSSSSSKDKQASSNNKSASTNTMSSSKARPNQGSDGSRPSHKDTRKPGSRNYNHPELKGQDNVRLIGPGADPSKNKAWMGDVAGLPVWGPGMLPAMAPESERGKGTQRQKDGVQKMDRK